MRELGGMYDNRGRWIPRLATNPVCVQIQVYRIKETLSWMRPDHTFNFSNHLGVNRIEIDGALHMSDIQWEHVVKRDLASRLELLPHRRLNSEAALLEPLCHGQH
eukprot:5227867-Amphidinium_carterae.3